MASALDWNSARAMTVGLPRTVEQLTAPALTTAPVTVNASLPTHAHALMVSRAQTVGSLLVTT